VYRQSGGWASKKKPWRAQIRIHGKIQSLGDFSSVEGAARAYDKTVRKHDLNRDLNFPLEYDNDDAEVSGG